MSLSPSSPKTEEGGGRPDAREALRARRSRGRHEKRIRRHGNCSDRFRGLRPR